MHMKKENTENCVKLTRTLLGLEFIFSLLPVCIRDCGIATDNACGVT